MQTGIVACQQGLVSLPRALLAVIGQIKAICAARRALQGLPACGEAFGASRWCFYRHFLPVRR